jgi:S1-C subfamily serine protease
MPLSEMYGARSSSLTFAPMACYADGKSEIPHLINLIIVMRRHREMEYIVHRKTILIAVCVLVSAVLGPLATEAGPPNVRTSQFDQQWLDTVVSIERLLDGAKEVPVGTGFIVITARKHLLLVTAKHVVQDDKGRLLSDLAYRVNRAGGSSQLLKDADLVKAGGAWFLAPHDDIAVRFMPFVQGASVKAMPLDRFIEETQVEAGTPLVALGFPMGLRSVDHALPIARRGMVGRADSKSLLADLFVFPGNSGGPVLYVPAFKTGGVTFGGAEIVGAEMLIGIVSSFIPYQDVAVSKQTRRPRVVFEENSGLANLVPAWVLKGFITTGSVDSFDQKLSIQK